MLSCHDKHAGLSGAFGQGQPPTGHLPLRQRAAADPPLPAAKAAGGTAQRTYLPAGRGFDWSLSAYKEGREAVPNPPVTINVRVQFGARGDGVADDTAALQVRCIAGGGRHRLG